MKKNVLLQKPANLKHFIFLQIKNIFFMVFICFIASCFSVLLDRIGMGKQNNLMVFLVGVLVITVLTKGYFYGFIASIISLLIFNYFFTVPYKTFQINNLQDYILIALFLISSSICGTMSSKFQRQTELSRQNEAATRLLYEISESFLNLNGKMSVLKNAVTYITQYTGYQCSIVLDSTKFGIRDIHYATEDFALRDRLNAKLYTLPIKGLSDETGTITLLNPLLPLSEKNDMIIKTVSYQMALVLDREFIYQQGEEIKIAMEREQLKSTLLRSISHDIRTPLTGIMGASSLIAENFETLDEASIKRLASDINEESAWLYNSIQNILDMTRINEGRLLIKKEYEAVDDLIQQAVSHVPWIIKSGRLQIQMPADIIMVASDGRLIVQVLINLLENAFQHSGNESHITLSAFSEDSFVVFLVTDDGLGIDESLKDTMFEQFVTLPRNVADGRHGVGLGLAICKTIVEAHGGIISAENSPTGGAVFRISLPVDDDEI